MTRLRRQEKAYPLCEAALDTQHILLWVSIIGTLISTLTGAGIFWLYKWKVDRMWAEYASRHNINGHRKD